MHNCSLFAVKRIVRRTSYPIKFILLIKTFDKLFRLRHLLPSKILSQINSCSGAIF